MLSESASMRFSIEAFCATSDSRAVLDLGELDVEHGARGVGRGVGLGAARGRLGLHARLERVHAGLELAHARVGLGEHDQRAVELAAQLRELALGRRAGVVGGRVGAPGGLEHADELLALGGERRLVAIELGPGDPGASRARRACTAGSRAARRRSRS